MSIGFPKIYRSEAERRVVFLVCNEFRVTRSYIYVQDTFGVTLLQMDLLGVFFGLRVTEKQLNIYPNFRRAIIWRLKDNL